MRLINCSTLRLETFNEDDDTPPFAILSHCWGREEIIYTDIAEGLPSPEEIRTSTRWRKISNACQMAIQRYNLQYIWVDTCCIDKRSSAELSEAINSMWAWYWRADVCMAFLQDVNLDGDLNDIPALESRWFTRGWTLQELIAPKILVFFDAEWRLIGDRNTLSTRWTDDVCNVDREILKDGGRYKIQEYCVATRLSWASKRQTTRREDRAYSLLGLFGVNMSTLYGEGYRSAFLRLQAKIFKTTADQSIFAWRDNSKIPPSPRSPWECKVYGDANKLCQKQIEDIADSIVYVDAIRPWRVNNERLELIWTCNTKPLETTHIFAPCLEYFDTKWHSQLIPSPAFKFPVKADFGNEAWKFCDPNPSKRYGPRTQMVLTRIMTWFNQLPATSIRVEYALYLGILPVQIRDAQLGKPSQQHIDGPSPPDRRYVAIHLLESSLEPATFRRVSPRDVYVVDMTPEKALSMDNYWPPGWVDKPEVCQNIFRFTKDQEEMEINHLNRLQSFIKPKIRDVFLSPPGEADKLANSVNLLTRPHTMCVRLQWVFMETSHLEKDWAIESDTHGDISGLQQTSFYHHSQPTSSRKRETKRFLSWYRHPKHLSMLDGKAQNSTIRVLLRHKLSDEAVCIIFSTRPTNIKRRERMNGDDEWARVGLEPLAHHTFVTQVCLVSPKLYHSHKIPDLGKEPYGHNDDFDKCLRVCNCPLPESRANVVNDPEKTPISPAYSFKSAFETIPAFPADIHPGDDSDEPACSRCDQPHVSPAVDPCDKFITFEFGHLKQKITLAFVEPKKRLIDDPGLGPMVNAVVVLGEPEDWFKKVQEDEDNGLTGAVLGETLWKAVGPPPALSEPNPYEQLKLERQKKGPEPIDIGGWRSVAMRR